MDNEDSTEPTKEASGELQSPMVAKISKWGTIVGLLLVILGVASLMLPGVTALAIEIWLGVMFICVGIGLLVQPPTQNRVHGSVTFELIWGVIYLLGGLVLLLAPKSGIITLALILGLVFIIDGIGRIMFASQAFTEQRKTWWIVDGLIAIILGGVILWNWPGDSAWIIGVLVGIRLLISGMVTVMVANMIRSNA